MVYIFAFAFGVSLGPISWNVCSEVSHDLFSRQSGQSTNANASRSFLSISMPSAAPLRLAHNGCSRYENHACHFAHVLTCSLDRYCRHNTTFDSIGWMDNIVSVYHFPHHRVDLCLHCLPIALSTPLSVSLPSYGSLPTSQKHEVYPSGKQWTNCLQIHPKPRTWKNQRSKRSRRSMNVPLFCAVNMRGNEGGAHSLDSIEVPFTTTTIMKNEGLLIVLGISASFQ